jgi:hypothetical protein
MTLKRAFKHTTERILLGDVKRLAAVNGVPHPRRTPPAYGTTKAVLWLDREWRVAEDFSFGLVATSRGLLHRSRAASCLASRGRWCHGSWRGHDCLRWRHGLRSGRHGLDPGRGWRPVRRDLLLRWSWCSLCIRGALDRGNYVAASGRGGERERGRRRRCRVEISTQIRRRLRRCVARRHPSDSDQRQSG